MQPKAAMLLNGAGIGIMVHFKALHPRIIRFALLILRGK
jgi:hypothetical protein